MNCAAREIALSSALPNLLLFPYQILAATRTALVSRNFPSFPKKNNLSVLSYAG
jgi:hypothetical protein